LMGLDVRDLLDAARLAAKAIIPAVEMGTAIGDYANEGRDKLTLVIDQKLETLGLWIEQLVAESTGKEGKGILPVNGEPLGAPNVYGNDRVFVSISHGSLSNDTQTKLDALAAAGHPVINRKLDDLYDLGAEFFQWEFATAVAGCRLGINPFDQPNVQEAKDATKELLSSFVRRGQLDERNKIAADDLMTIYGGDDASDAESVSVVLRRHLAGIKPGDYVAFLNYIEETPEIDQRFQELRAKLRNATHSAVTIGYGPRFLHSTGQLHKGGPDTGVFFQIIANDITDFAIPGEPYTFTILKQAQALGDFRALVKRGRRVIGIDLGDNTAAGLERLVELLHRSS